VKQSVLVLGCGSIGRRHISNLRSLGCRVVAFDPDRERSAWVSKNLSCPVAASLEAGLDSRPDAVWICVPPRYHGDSALAALERGIPVFVEKPLAHDATTARAIAAAARRKKVPAAVGYQLRAHPALRGLANAAKAGRWGRLLGLRAQLGQYLPDWRPWQDYRDSYTARKALGGGIVLDGSHEIDLALWLAGPASSVYCSAKRVSRLEIDVEDLAALTLEFRSGAIGEIHLDMVSRAYRRGLELSFEKATVLWDWPSMELSAYSASSKKWARRKFELDFNTLYVDEARAFLRAVRGDRSAALVSADEGLATMAVVEAAARSAASGRKEIIRS
jgi:predicted dehydrogenase